MLDILIKKAQINHNEGHISLVVTIQEGPLSGTRLRTILTLRDRSILDLIHTILGPSFNHKITEAYRQALLLDSRFTTLPACMDNKRHLINEFTKLLANQATTLLLDHPTLDTPLIDLLQTKMLKNVQIMQTKQGTSLTQKIKLKLNHSCLLNLEGQLTNQYVFTFENYKQATRKIFTLLKHSEKILQHIAKEMQPINKPIQGYVSGVDMSKTL